MATIDLGFRKIREIGARSGRAVLALVAWPASLSLASQFFLASLAVLVAAMLLTGEWVGQMVERSVLTRSAALSALYVESALGDHLAALASQPRLDPAEVAAFDRLLTASPLGERVNAFKVWSSDGEVLYSPDRRLIGRRFDVDGGLELALQGEVSADLSDLTQPENAYERERWSRLLEVYTPVRQQDPGGRILAVVEFYQAPDAVDREVGAARREAWALVAVVTTFIYVLLAGLVKRGSDTIARNLRELAMLHARLRVAGVRTIALNEQSLRRISADLHDGPSQVLALALLRLDRLNDTAACAPNSGHATGEIEVIRGCGAAKPRTGADRRCLRHA
jgi:signal transduction histidine kinase